MLKLKIGIVGNVDKKDLDYIRAKILQYFPPINKIFFVNFPTVVESRLIHMLDWLILDKSYEKKKKYGYLLDLRDLHARRKDALFLILYFSPSVPDCGWAYPEHRIACQMINKSPKKSRINMLHILHELGHLFNLNHYENHFNKSGKRIIRPCLMAYLKHANYSSPRLCEKCKERIETFK